MATQETMLIMVSSQANNNKFYHVMLDDSGQVTKRWGRVGATGASSKENTGITGYNRAIASKKKKGYVETEVMSLQDEINDGAKEDLSKIARSVLVNDSKDSVLGELVDTLVSLNNHDILETSGGLIKVNNSGLITTPLGLIKSSSITSATSVLHDLEKTKVTSSAYPNLLEEYLRLIPQKVGYKRGWAETFFNDKNTFTSQAEFLKQLSDSLTLQEDRKKLALDSIANDDNADDVDIAIKYEKLFKLKVGVLEDEKEFARIEKYYEAGKSSYHASSALSLKRVFTIQDEEGQPEYDEAKARLGNELELWHGTRANNILSILRKKLYCPPVSGSGIQIQGRLFGPGIYLAQKATKSLSYSQGGTWDRGPRDNRCFMFLTKGVLGKEYNPNTYGLSDGSIQRSGKYDSIFAHAHQTGLKNDEIIIWDTKQINIRYLCEFGI